MENNVESRVKKTILNAQVNLLFYFLMLALSFFSRKIFIQNLTAEFVGLTSTLYNLLGFLNLAELGIGSAIGYVLYQPLFKKDHSKINEIISVFSYLYRLIGTTILCAGILLSLFLPFIFSSAGLNLYLIYFAFYSFLFSSLIGYFFNYKQTLLGADQRNYVVTIYFQSANILKAAFQILLAYYTKNCFVWVIVELMFAIIYSYILNSKIKSVYPWLNSNPKSGKTLLKEYPDVITYTKQLFVHKIASFAQFQTTPFILYMFTSLKVVACYTNYTMIVTQLLTLANKILGSTEAGVGNLIAERNIGKIFNVYHELTSFRYFVAGVEIFAIYHLIDPFILLWLGEDFVMKGDMLILVLINMFIMQTRGTNDQFINAYGLFHDIWAPILESVLSLSFAVWLGNKWGLEGVLAGMLVGQFFIVVCWKPFFLFKNGFKKSVLVYWKIIFFHLFALTLSFMIASKLCSTLISHTYDGYLTWLLNAIIYVAVYSILSLFSLLVFTPGARYLFLRLLRTRRVS